MVEEVLAWQLSRQLDTLLDDGILLFGKLEEDKFEEAIDDAEESLEVVDLELFFFSSCLIFFSSLDFSFFKLTLFSLMFLRVSVKFSTLRSKL